MIVLYLANITCSNSYNLLMKRTFSLLFLIFFLFIYTSCKSKSARVQSSKNDSGYVAPVPGNITEQEASRYKNEIEYFFNKHLMPRGFNGAILIAKKGNIIFEKYNGFEDIRKKYKTIDEHSKFHLASLSKTFTAMAVLKLQEQGKLNINDTLNKYFPAFPYPNITVKMLLTHRSGMPNYVYFMEKLGWDKHQYLKNEDVLDYLIKFKPPYTSIPGKHFTYCNTNYILLSLIIEKASEERYADYLQKTFFTPLQMNDTYVFSLADTLTAMPSYNVKGIQERLTYLDGGTGDKNIYSTVRDILKWDQALYSGQLFHQSTLDSAFTPYSNEKPGIKNYGLGWRMNIYPNGKKIVFHTGWWHGNNSILIRLMADSATIIVVANKYNRGVYETKKLANIFQNYFENGDEQDENVSVGSEIGEQEQNPVQKNNSLVKQPSRKRAVHKSRRK
ncbi:serine hydrolase domain-containing protein [soil metagenome]